MSNTQSSSGPSSQPKKTLPVPNDAHWETKRVRMTKGAMFDDVNVVIKVAKDMNVEGKLIVLGSLFVGGILTAERITLARPERRFEDDGAVIDTPEGNWTVIDQPVHFGGTKYVFGQDFECLSSGSGQAEYIVKGDLRIAGDLQVTHLTATGYVSVKVDIRCDDVVINPKMNTADMPRT